MEQNSTGRKVFQLLAVFVLLVVLPAGSYYYLKKGFNRRLAALEELQNYGTVADFQLNAQNGAKFTAKDMMGKVTLVSFGNRPQLFKQMSLLNEQFDDTKDMLFVSFLSAENTLSAKSLEQYATDYAIVGKKQWYVLGGENRMVQQLAKERFSLPKDGQQLENNSYFALVDTDLIIRNYYDTEKAEDMGKLAEHIAIILPQLPEKDIVFEREKEK